MLEELIPGHDVPQQCWGPFHDGEDGQTMEEFRCFRAVWALRVQRRFAVRFMRTIHGNNWNHGLHFEDESLTQLGRDQELLTYLEQR